MVIDVLAKVRKPTGNKQLYEADYEALTGLTQLASELGLAVVVVHHTRKMASDDLMETISGSFGISGAADTILVLANKASGTVLDVRGRDVEFEGVGDRVQQGILPLAHSRYGHRGSHVGSTRSRSGRA